MTYWGKPPEGEPDPLTKASRRFLETVEELTRRFGRQPVTAEVTRALGETRVATWHKTRRLRRLGWLRPRIVHDGATTAHLDPLVLMPCARRALGLLTVVYTVAHISDRNDSEAIRTARRMAWRLRDGGHDLVPIAPWLVDATTYEGDSFDWAAGAALAARADGVLILGDPLIAASPRGDVIAAVRSRVPVAVADFDAIGDGADPWANPITFDPDTGRADLR